MRGRSAAIVRSDSSPSTTSQPSPVPALPPSCGTSAPMSQAGSRPRSSRQKAIIALVVVLPCAPATTIESRSDTSSPSSAARVFPRTRSTNAVDTNASQPSGGGGGSSEISTSIPASCSRYAVGVRSQPRTSAPQARASNAYALIPAPPMPAIQSLRPSSGEGNELLGDLVRRIRPGKAGHRRRHLRKPLRIVEQGADEVRRLRKVALRHDDRTTALLEVARVLRLVVAGREEPGNEHCRLGGRSELPDRAAGPGEREVAGTERSPELLGEREQAVVRPGHPRAQLVVVARSCQVQHRRSRLAERSERELVQRPRAERAAEDKQNRAAPGKAEQPARLLLRQSLRARRNRSARDQVLRSVASGNREREEHALRERHGEPVGKAETRSGR